MEENYTNRSEQSQIAPVHALEAYGGMDVQLHLFLTLALDGLLVSLTPQPISLW